MVRVERERLQDQWCRLGSLRESTEVNLQNDEEGTKGRR